MALTQETVAQAAELQAALNAFLENNREFVPTVQPAFDGSTSILLVAKIGYEDSKRRDAAAVQRMILDDSDEGTPN